ncbi:MAG: glycosyltransferase family 39 protein [Bacteroidota bacterium]
MWLLRNRYYQLLPFLLLYLLFLLGQFIGVMDIDAAQYAAISMEMMESGDFLQTKLRGEDYLDKPPLLFWLSALSFQLFGINHFAFRFFPILISFLGFYATYRLARLYYNEVISYLSALLIASSQACILMNHDLRTDNLLTSFVIVAIWQIAAYNIHKKWKYLIGGFVAIGLAMLAKGPIGLMAPIFAFSVDFAVRRQWKFFFRWEWLVGIGIAALLLLPMSIGLYQQFDAQPVKGVSGLRFFYWTQSFGRITGENTWSNNPDPLFQVHSFLWGFLPWSLLAFAGYIRETLRLWKSRFKLPNNDEALVWGGLTLVFIAMSLSKFQLPHYTYPVFPLAAILGAKFIYYLIYHPKIQKGFRWALGIQIFTISLLWLLAGVLLLHVFRSPPIWIWLMIVPFLGAVIISFWKLSYRIDRLVMPSFLTIVGVNIVLNGHFYPRLLQYQSEIAVAQYVQKREDIPLNRVYRAGASHFHSLDFYMRGIVPIISDVHQLKSKGAGEYWVYVDQKYLAIFQTVYPSTTIVKKFNDFPVTTLNINFLNRATRSSTLQNTYLIRITQ